MVAVRTSMPPVLSIVHRWIDGSGACRWRLVASWWLMQEVLHTMRCTAVRFHGRAAGDRHVQSVRAEPASLRPRAARGACVRSGTMQRHPWGLVSLWGCVRRRVCRAGGRVGCGCARGNTRPQRRSAPCACRAIALPGIRSLATTTEAVGKLLGFRHTARRRLRRAVCEGVGSRGSLEPGATEQRALRMPSPLLLRRKRAVVGRGHGCGQRTRERRWRRAVPRPSARQIAFGYVGFLSL